MIRSAVAATISLKKSQITRVALLAACLIAGPALAAPECPDLAAARAQARATAAPLGFDVVDKDGANALALEQSQDVPQVLQTPHLSLMTNPKTGRAVALLNDGPGCTFGSVFTVYVPQVSPMQSAVDFLRYAR